MLKYSDILRTYWIFWIMLLKPHLCPSGVCVLLRQKVPVLIRAVQGPLYTSPLHSFVQGPKYVTSDIEIPVANPFHQVLLRVKRTHMKLQAKIQPSSSILNCHTGHATKQSTKQSMFYQWVTNQAPITNSHPTEVLGTSSTQSHPKHPHNINPPMHTLSLFTPNKNPHHKSHNINPNS